MPGHAGRQRSAPRSAAPDSPASSRRGSGAAFPITSAFSGSTKRRSFSPARTAAYRISASTAASQASVRSTAPFKSSFSPLPGSSALRARNSRMNRTRPQNPADRLPPAQTFACHHSEITARLHLKTADCLHSEAAAFCTGGPERGKRAGLAGAGSIARKKPASLLRIGGSERDAGFVVFFMVSYRKPDEPRLWNRRGKHSVLPLEAAAGFLLRPPKLSPAARREKRVYQRAFFAP